MAEPITESAEPAEQSPVEAEAPVPPVVAEEASAGASGPAGFQPHDLIKYPFDIFAGITKDGHPFVQVKHVLSGQEYTMTPLQAIALSNHIEQAAIEMMVQLGAASIRATMEREALAMGKPIIHTATHLPVTGKNGRRG